MSAQLGPSTWLTAATIGLCTLAASTAAYLGAYCPPSVACLGDVPRALLGGLVFAPPALIVAAIVVALLALQPSRRVPPMPLTASTVLLLVAFHIAGGALAGAVFGLGDGR
ncbi:MAG TPA: hypothetical protein VJP76_05100 [Candidatus Tumulicola sp.]|nr:hypothetical protein [Candidatus Tumulicola sp.]